MEDIKKYAASLLALVLVVAGAIWLIGGDDEADDASDTTTSEVEETTSSDDQSNDEDSAVAKSTVVDLAVATDDLSTLVTAVTAADLVDTLSGEGPFTVFAPVNKAFNDLPEGVLDELLLDENQSRLKDVLTYHVAAGKVMSTDLSDKQMVEMVNGEMVQVLIDDDGNVTVGGAKVTSVDIEGSNGVVHIIDTVLLPSAER